MINHEVFDMNLLQRLFDRLIGVAQCEAALRDNAHRIFTAPSIDVSAFEKPACWRRAGRVQRHCQTE